MSRVPAIGPKPRPGDKSRRAELEALYAELPSLSCRGLCTDSCGPISMSRIEWQRICRRSRSETLTLLPDMTCPMLDDGRCSVYDIRPMICRLWGLVETMTCPWGCKPDRYLTHEEGGEFLRRAMEIGT